MHELRTYLPFLLLGSLVTAQDPIQSSSPLVVRTSSLMYARMLQNVLDESGERLAKLEPGKHYRLTLDDGGVMAKEQGDGEIHGLEIDARVRELAKLFAAEMQQAQMQAEAMANMAGAMGGGGADLGKLVAAVFALPAQIETLTVRSSGAPLQADGLKVDIDLQPVQGTMFAKFAAAMQPHKEGAPQPLGADAMLKMRFGLDTAGMTQLSELTMPLVSMMAGMQGKEWQGLMQQMVGLYDGSGCAVMDMGGGGMSMVMGVNDAAKLQELLGGEPYRKAVKAGFENNPMFVDEPKFTTEEHRGTTIIAVAVEMDERMAGMNPMFGGESTMRTFGAVAGGWVLNSMMTNDLASVRGLIDAALDQKIVRAPMPGGALFTLDLAVGRMAEMFGGGTDAPEKASMALARSGAGISIQVKVQ